MKHCFVSILVLAMTAGLADARAQHAEHTEATDAASTPRIFWDKSPTIIRYQLGRLSNEELVQVERDASDPQYLPAYEALLIRPGLASQFRQEAVTALAKLKQTDEPTELLNALQNVDAEQSGVVNQLARMLVSQDAEKLKRSQSALEELAGSDAPATARRSAFAALSALEDADSLWEFAADKPAGGVHLLSALSLVPDAARRSAFFAKIKPLLAPEAEAELRSAAITAAATMPEHAPEVFDALSLLVANGANVPECARALASLPQDHWPRDAIRPLVDALLDHARKVPEDRRTENDFLDVTDLGASLATKLPKEEAVTFRKAFRDLGIQVIRLGTLYEQMLYDKTLLVVEAGKPVELVFENTDAMQHNWVLLKPDTIEEIGTAADKMPPAPDNQGRSYVPSSPKVLEATALANSGETVRLRFTAPSQPDDYPYICTFPGHWMRMRGVLKVVADVDQYLAQQPSEPTTPKMTQWTLPDLAPELSKIAGGGNAENGQALFISTGCFACHTVGENGMAYGPDLTQVFQKYQNSVEAILSEILEPSKAIEPRYRAFNFKRAGGDALMGFIVKEDANSLHIQIGPGEAMIQQFSKDDIVSREPQAISLMPSGLLNLLTKEQIIDLLAYLRAGASQQSALAK